MADLFIFTIGSFAVGSSVMILISNKNIRTKNELRTLNEDIEMGYVTKDGIKPRLIGTLFLLLGLAIMYYFYITKPDNMSIWIIILSGIFGVVTGAFFQYQRNHPKL